MEWLRRLLFTPKSCATCEALKQQLSFMQEHARAKEEQVSMVLRSHFDRANVMPVPVPKRDPLPLNALMDVEDDSAFLEMVHEVTQ